MSIGTKEFERLMDLYNCGYISRGSILSYIYGDREESSSDIIFNLYGEQVLFIPPAVPEIENLKIEEPEIFETIENRFEILDL